MQFFLHLADNAIYLAMILYLANHFLNLSLRRLRLRGLYLLGLLVVSAVLFPLTESQAPLEVLVTFLMIYLALCLMFSESCLALMVCEVFLFLISTFLVLVADTLMLALFINADPFLEQFNHNIVSPLIALGFVAMSYKLLGPRSHSLKIRNLSWKMWALVIAVGGLDCVFAMIFYGLGNRDFVLNTGSTQYRLIQILFSICIYLQVYLIIELIVSRNLYREKELLTHQILDEKAAYYEMRRQQDENTRRIRHDMKAMLAVLKELCRNHEYGKLQEELEKVVGRVEAIGTGATLNDTIVEAIVNRYSQEAEQKGIRLKVKGSMPNGHGVDMLDLSTIFSNLLANALEACEACNEKWVETELSYDEDWIYIQVRNSCSSTLMVKETADSRDFPKTGKQNALNHGFGLENVFRSVKEYHGKMYLKAGDGIFEVRIYIRNGGRK